MRQSFPRLTQERVTALTALVVLLTAIIYPVSQVIGQSFQVSRLEPGFTLQWYARLASSEALAVLGNTLVLVLVSSAFALLLGLCFAWMIERVDVPFRFLFGLIPTIPLLIPPLMNAAGWAFLLSPTVGYINSFLRAVFGLPSPGPLDIYTLPGIIFVVIIDLVPFTYAVFFPALRAMDSSMEEAAYISGASRLAAARTVTLSLLRPALLGALILALVVSAAHFAIPQMLGGGKIRVLTTDIYRFMNQYPVNTGAATATSMLVLLPSLLLLWVQYRLLRSGSYATVGGKGAGRRLIRDARIRWISTILLAIYGLVALVLPIGAITLVAFMRFWSGTVTWDLFTLSNFEWIFFVYQGTWLSIQTSLILSFIGASSCVLLGFVVAYLTVRSRRPEVRALDFIGMLPAGIPATVLGVGFLIAFSRPPLFLYGTIWLLFLAYLVLLLPHAVRPVAASIRQVSNELEDASRMSGATWLKTVGLITLPLVRPSILGTWVLLFVILSREVSVSVFLISPGVRVIGTTLFDLWDNGRGPQMAAFSLMILIISIAFMVVANLLALGQIGLRDTLARRLRVKRRPASAAPIGRPESAPRALSGE